MKKMELNWPALITASLLTSFSSIANSASFDCNKAKSTSEIIICNNDEISKADEKLSAAYKEAQKKHPNPKKLIEAQKVSWEKREKECSSKECLTEWYSERQQFYDSINLIDSEETPEKGQLKTKANNINSDKLKEASDALEGRNYRTAATLIRQLALDGDTGAQKTLGAMYNQGLIPQINKNNAADWINPSNSLYIENIKKNHNNKIFFESQEAEKAIINFNIDCNARMKNGHFLPLINILYARVASLSNGESWLETTVIERNGDTRIIDTLRSKEKILDESVVFQVNKWGELQPLGGITVDALKNACFDSYGPIWLLK